MFNDEKLLHTRHSAFNTIVITEDDDGFRTLRFGYDGVPQSIVKPGHPEHLELAYACAMPLFLAFRREPARILIVGLGGGSLPAFFHRLLPDTLIDVVEIDKDVLDIAKTYCGFSEDARLHVYIEDGRDFIESRHQHYDVIILDSFDSESIPPHLLTIEFLHAIRDALTPNGIAVANIWGQDTNPKYHDMLRTYLEAFAELYIIDVPAPGTKLFVALSAPSPMTRDELIANARQITIERDFSYDLIDSIAGFKNADQEDLRAGRVLRDK